MAVEWSPWSLALSAAGAPLALGTRVPAAVGRLGDGPFERINHLDVGGLRDPRVDRGAGLHR